MSRHVRVPSHHAVCPGHTRLSFVNHSPVKRSSRGPELQADVPVGGDLQLGSGRRLPEAWTLPPAESRARPALTSGLLRPVPHSCPPGPHTPIKQQHPSLGRQLALRAGVQDRTGLLAQQPPKPSLPNPLAAPIRTRSSRGSSLRPLHPSAAARSLNCGRHGSWMLLPSPTRPPLTCAGHGGQSQVPTSFFKASC